MSSAAVVIGTLRVKGLLCSLFSAFIIESLCLVHLLLKALGIHHMVHNNLGPSVFTVNQIYRFRAFLARLD